MSYPSHDDWEDISDESRHEHHWHAENPGDEPYLSIRLADENEEPLGGYRKGWSVEIYPDPETGHEARWYFSPNDYDDPEAKAVEKAQELMEKHA